jgi:hypothetical protein
MSITDALNEAGAKPAGKRPYFLTPEVERVLAITMAVAQELAVSRQRLDALERIMKAKGYIADTEIDTFVPDHVAAAERAVWTQEYISRILRIVQQESEAAARGDEVASGDLGDELARD